jgi:RNA polymerase subunit RPABC4/transcription elongation factor Spt4
MSERRCPSCGGLVAADAEWCGQCLAPLGDGAPASAAAQRGAPGRAPASVTERFERREDSGTVSVWRCPACEADNPLDANACRVCGTSFASIFDEPSRTGPAVTPASAAAWSLLLPGLGHWLAGRRADAAARFVLAAWVGGALVVLVASRSGKQGLGSIGALVVLFSIAVLGLWVEATVDARRVALGMGPVVSTRALLWASVALVGLSIVLSTVLVLPSLRSGSPGAVR